MRKEDCYYLGKITRRHGLAGNVILKLDTDQPELYNKLESIFVEINGLLVPFFIEKSSIHREKFLRTQFEDMDSEEAADTIVGRDVYLPLTMLPKLEGNKFYYHEVVGFDAIDQRLGNFGTILRISDNGVQALFEVQKDEAIILIPLIDEFIIEVNRKNKSILFNTPEGLIDLYI